MFLLSQHRHMRIGRPRAPRGAVNHNEPHSSGVDEQLDLKLAARHMPGEATHPHDEKSYGTDAERLRNQKQEGTDPLNRNEEPQVKVETSVLAHGMQEGLQSPHHEAETECRMQDDKGTAYVVSGHG